MFQVTASALRKSGMGFVSAFAMTAALAGGTMMASTLFAAPAHAQDKADYSKAFVEAYAPVNEALSAAADAAAAEPLRPQLDSVIAAVETVDDKMAAGSLLIAAGGKLGDTVLQRRGLEMQLEAGKVPEAQVGQFNFFVGNFYFGEQNYAAARPFLERAIAAGYTENSPQGMLAETYFRGNQQAQGLTYLKGEIDKRDASGVAVEESWLRRGLGVAYESGLKAEAGDWAAMLVARYPTERNWRDAVRVVKETNSFTPEERLDLLRLMLVTNSFDNGQEVLDYVEAADPRRMPNEVVRVVDYAVSKDLVAMDNPYIKESYDLASGRAAADRTETAGLVAEAQSSANPRVALGVGDSFMSFQDYAKAEELLQTALGKAGVDAARANTRLGIAQAMQGKYADAKASLGQVSGTRGPIAELWIAYVDSKQGV